MGDLSTSRIGKLRGIGLGSEYRERLVEAIEDVDLPADDNEDARFRVKDGEIWLLVSTFHESEEIPEPHATMLEALPDHVEVDRDESEFGVSSSSGGCYANIHLPGGHLHPDTPGILATLGWQITDAYTTSDGDALIVRVERDPERGDGQ